MATNDSERSGEVPKSDSDKNSKGNNAVPKISEKWDVVHQKNLAREKIKENTDAELRNQVLGKGKEGDLEENLKKNLLNNLLRRIQTKRNEKRIEHNQIVASNLSYFLSFLEKIKKLVGSETKEGIQTKISERHAEVSKNGKDPNDDEDVLELRNKLFLLDFVGKFKDLKIDQIEQVLKQEPNIRNEVERIYSELEKKRINEEIQAIEADPKQTKKHEAIRQFIKSSPDVAIELILEGRKGREKNEKDSVDYMEDEFIEKYKKEPDRFTVLLKALPKGVSEKYLSVVEAHQRTVDNIKLQQTELRRLEGILEQEKKELKNDREQYDNLLGGFENDKRNLEKRKSDITSEAEKIKKDYDLEVESLQNKILQTQTKKNEKNQEITKLKAKHKEQEEKRIKESKKIEKELSTNNQELISLKGSIRRVEETLEKYEKYYANNKVRSLINIFSKALYMLSPRATSPNGDMHKKFLDKTPGAYEERNNFLDELSKYLSENVKMSTERLQKVSNIINRLRNAEPQEDGTYSGVGEPDIIILFRVISEEYAKPLVVEEEHGRQLTLKEIKDKIEKTRNELENNRAEIVRLESNQEKLERRFKELEVVELPDYKSLTEKIALFDKEEENLNAQKRELEQKYELDKKNNEEEANKVSELITVTLDEITNIIVEIENLDKPSETSLQVHSLQEELNSLREQEKTFLSQVKNEEVKVLEKLKGKELRDFFSFIDEKTKKIPKPPTANEDIFLLELRNDLKKLIEKENKWLLDNAETFTELLSEQQKNSLWEKRKGELKKQASQSNQYITSDVVCLLHSELESAHVLTIDNKEMDELAQKNDDARKLLETLKRVLKNITDTKEAIDALAREKVEELNLDLEGLKRLSVDDERIILDVIKDMRSDINKISVTSKKEQILASGARLQTIHGYLNGIEDQIKKNMKDREDKRVREETERKAKEASQLTEQESQKQAELQRAKLKEAEKLAEKQAELSDSRKNLQIQEIEAVKTALQTQRKIIGENAERTFIKGKDSNAKIVEYGLNKIVMPALNEELNALFSKLEKNTIAYANDARRLASSEQGLLDKNKVQKLIQKHGDIHNSEVKNTIERIKDLKNTIAEQIDAGGRLDKQAKERIADQHIEWMVNDLNSTAFLSPASTAKIISIEELESRRNKLEAIALEEIKRQNDERAESIKKQQEKDLEIVSEAIARLKNKNFETTEVLTPEEQQEIKKATERLAAQKYEQGENAARIPEVLSDYQRALEDQLLETRTYIADLRNQQQQLLTSSNAISKEMRAQHNRLFGFLGKLHGEMTTSKELSRFHQKNVQDFDRVSIIREKYEAIRKKKTKKQAKSQKRNEQINDELKFLSEVQAKSRAEMDSLHALKINNIDLIKKHGVQDLTLLSEEFQSFLKKPDNLELNEKEFYEIFEKNLQARLISPEKPGETEEIKSRAERINKTLAVLKDLPIHTKNNLFDLAIKITKTQKSIATEINEDEREKAIKGLNNLKERNTSLIHENAFSPNLILLSDGFQSFLQKKGDNLELPKDEFYEAFEKDLRAELTSLETPEPTEATRSRIERINKTLAALKDVFVDVKDDLLNSAIKIAQTQRNVTSKINEIKQIDEKIGDLREQELSENKADADELKQDQERISQIENDLMAVSQGNSEITPEKQAILKLEKAVLEFGAGVGAYNNLFNALTKTQEIMSSVVEKQRFEQRTSELKVQLEERHAQEIEAAKEEGKRSRDTEVQGLVSNLEQERQQAAAKDKEAKSKLDAAVAEKEQTIAGLREELAAAGKERTESEGRHAQAIEAAKEEGKRSRDAEVRELESNLEQERQQAAAKEAEAKSKLDAVVAEKDQAIAELQGKLEAAGKERTESEGRHVQAIEAAKEEGKRSRDAEVRELESNLEQERQQAAAKEAEAKSKLDAVVAEKEQTIAGLREELAAAGKERTESEGRHAQAIEAAKEEGKRSRDVEVQGLESNLEQARQQAAAKDKEAKSKLDAAVAEKDQAIAELQGKLAAAGKERTESEGRHAQAIEAAKEEGKRSRDVEVQGLESNLEQARQQAVAKDQAITALKDKLAEADEKIKEQETALTSLREKLKALEQAQSKPQQLDKAATDDKTSEKSTTPINADNAEVDADKKRRVEEPILPNAAPVQQLQPKTPLQPAELINDQPDAVPIKTIDQTKTPEKEPKRPRGEMETGPPLENGDRLIDGHVGTPKARMAAYNTFTERARKVGEKSAAMRELPHKILSIEGFKLFHDKIKDSYGKKSVLAEGREEQKLKAEYEKYSEEKKSKGKEAKEYQKWLHNRDIKQKVFEGVSVATSADADGFQIKINNVPQITVKPLANKGKISLEFEPPRPGTAWKDYPDDQTIINYLEACREVYKRTGKNTISFSDLQEFPQARVHRLEELARLMKLNPKFDVDSQKALDQWRQESGTRPFALPTHEPGLSLSAAPQAKAADKATVTKPTPTVSTAEAPEPENAALVVRPSK